MSLLVRLSTDPGALLVRDTDDPLALAVTESTSPLALRVQESTSPLAQRVRGLFSPSQLPGLAAWYDAADSSTVLTSVGPDVPATNGQTVRRWLDKSGNGRHLDQADLALQPTFTDGRIVGDGANDFLRAAGFTIALPYTVYFISRFAANNTTAVCYSLGTGNLPEIGAYGSVTPGSFYIFNGGNFRPVTRAAQLDVDFVDMVILAATGNSTYRSGLAAAVTGNAGNTTSSEGITLFARGNGATPGAAQIREWLCYSGSHTTDEQTRVISYLGRKWGITL
jgi:hypothetical protein